MSRLALFVAVVACAPAAAQTKVIDTQVKKDLNEIRQVERTEDVEVFRRILNRALGVPNELTTTEREVPNTGRGVILSDGTFHSGLDRLITVSSPVGPFDGVYLPGHGIVFTLKVPASAGIMLDAPAKSIGLLDTCLKCHASVAKHAVEPAPSAAPPLTEWDRTRAELGGKKLPPEPKAALAIPTVCDPGKMAEAILGKLFENARHVRHLAPTDRVTVVVTFDGYSGSARNRLTLSSGGWLGDLPTRPGPADRPGFTAEEAAQLSLGDLHLKQGKPQDAAAAYERALVRFKDPVMKINPSLPPAKRTELATELQKGIRDAYRHLAQAYLATNESEKAQTALDRARNFLVELTTKAPPVPGIPVPAKLVLGIAKADLDKADADAAAFKKAVTVETVGFPPADRK